MSDKIETLEKDVQKLKNIAWVVGVVAVIFGISGGFGLSILNKSQAEIKDLNKQLESINSTTEETKSKLVTIREQEENNFKNYIVAQKNMLSIDLGKAIITFEGKTCPNGWQEYPKAYGMFVRGIDKSGNQIDPDGERAPGSPQEDLIKKHNHQIASSYLATINQPNEAVALTQSYRNVTTGDDGGSETRPKNIALLYCIKE